jgi:Tol biopolymer transport system component
MFITPSPMRTGVIAAASLAALAIAACGDSEDKQAGAPATSSDAQGSIVYEKELGPDTQLFIARPDGTGERRLTRVDGNALHPDWSPDGKRIAFHIEHTNAKPHPYCSIALINADGSGLTDLADRRRGCDGSPSFTPDGRRIVFGTFDDVKDVEGIASVDVSGADRRRIPTPWRAGVAAPLTSPDGKWVTFVRLMGEEGARNSLFAMRPDGSQLHRLTPPSWAIGDKYDWSADGKLIVVTTHAHFVRPGESANVVTIHPDGTVATRITRFTGGRKSGFAGSFSPDGKRIILRLERGETYGLATVDRDGRNLRAPTRFSTDQRSYIDWGAR